MHGSDASLEVRESISISMRHKYETAKSTYSIATSSEKAKSGLELAHSLFKGAASIAVGGASGDAGGVGSGDGVHPKRGRTVVEATDDETEDESDDEETSSSDDYEPPRMLFNVQRLIAMRTKPDGSAQWLCRWDDDSDGAGSDTWEDEDLLSSRMVREFYQRREEKRPKTRKRVSKRARLLLTGRASKADK